MSIPPLVCSTPPPLEQCEDDKDPEDFDLHYNLSQEEDDENNDFQFSSFSTYTSFNTSTKDSDKNLSISTSEQKLEEVSCDKVHNNVNEQNTEKQSINSSNPADMDLTFDEDVLIEDLNLKINQEPTSNSAKNSPQVSHSITDVENIVQDLQTDIPLNSNNISQNDYKFSSPNEENNKESAILSPTDKSKPFINEVAEELHEKTIVECNEESVSNINSVDKDDVDDDFEDFDEFKFTSTDNKSEIVIDAADPWANEAPDDDGFGDFTANFEHGHCELPNLTNVEGESQIKNTVSETQTELENTKDNDNDDEDDGDDDFGEFDEFKCSVTVNKNNEDSIATMQYQQVPVLNFQSDNENHIIESINKVLQSIFLEEITDSEDGLGNRLNATLGETWRYLRETDTRQPYMVNWNNSLAQKTLLKALCIDTRNILFGPKWTYNTPKFAANLSAAPLRPQKPISPANVPQNDQANSDKTVKTSWVDPFTADGQESCNVENESTVIEAGPTDLDVFEAAMSTKTDKIFSSTLNIQPIRQINLPDTHIFTPTDSETPRSKTIHYDSNNTTHTILLPQPVTSTSKMKSDLPQEKSDNDLDNETEYWEFQDFRGTADKKASNVNEKLKDKNNVITVNKDALPKPNYTIETQVLQPIKLEPIMPTLNWPNPGEVKETFDDFSDLVSKSISLNEIQESELKQESSKYSNSENTHTISEKKHFEETTATGSNQLEDDFDMFQSALPSTTSISQVDFNSRNSLVNQDTSSQIADFDSVFTKIDPLKSKSDNISLPSTRPIENTILKSGNLTNVNELKFKMQPSSSPGMQLPNTTLLQPTPVTSVTTQQSQQKTGQILQPLSLESYSQINWPNPGIDLQDLSRFNPVESLQSFKSDTSNHSKNASPIHNKKTLNNIQVSDEDIWGEFVSSKPKLQQPLPNKQSTFVDDDEWTDFVSSPSVNTQNGLNTISFNVHTNAGIQKSSNSTKHPLKNNDIPLDIPTLNYITPKTSNQKTYKDRHFQNL